MLTIIEKLLDAHDVARFQAQLVAAEWQDGRSTAGSDASAVKRNLQLAESSPSAIELGNHILRKLGSQPLFISAALPERIYPPRFNLYRDGGCYGVHVDAAIMRVASAGVTIRTDLAATLFLSDPETYEGGELMIEGQFGAQAVKLQAGDMVLYPASSLHRVMPVTRGERLASFFWVQSAVADDGMRSILFDLDQSIQALAGKHRGNDADLARLRFVYHNLLRRSAVV